MSSLNLEAILAPISQDDPTGPDLLDDPLYADLITKSQVFEQPLASINGEFAKECRAIASLAESFLGRSKNTWITVFLVQAQLNAGGLPDLAQGLKIVAGLLEKYWSSIHPRSDDD